MEENNDIATKFREMFSDFDPSPPERGWVRLKNHLHAEPRNEGFWSWITQLPVTSPRIFRLSAGFVILITGLLLGLVWFSSGEHFALRGHAYSGELRLCRGTAYLFKVEDKAKPFDSLKNIRSSDIDEQGYYEFSRIEPGKYLVRVAPMRNTEGHKKFHPSWYDQQIAPDSAQVIHVESSDMTVDVHLLPRH